MSRTTAISNMKALGATSIMSGLGWGLRVLSPTEPFTEGRSYTDEDNTKIVVLMTDGENTYYPNSTFVKSWYGAYGYIWKGHLGTTSTSTSTIVAKENARTAAACVNIKAAGIKVYTLAFNVTDSTTLNMLKTCASDPAMAFQSNSNGRTARRLRGDRQRHFADAHREVVRPEGLGIKRPAVDAGLFLWRRP